MKRNSLFIVLLFYILPVAEAQVNYKVSEESTMSITGTSTIHDWTSTVNEIKGKYEFKENILDKKLPKNGSIVSSLTMQIPVLSIESPRGETMDNKTYNALLYEEYPNITFEVKSDNILNTNHNTFKLQVNGDLTLAGLTKNIDIVLEGEKTVNNNLKFKGSYPIDMLSYEIEPPSAMFGQIKTGKDVTIDFELTLIRE